MDVGNDEKDDAGKERESDHGHRHRGGASERPIQSKFSSLMKDRSI